MSETPPTPWQRAKASRRSRRSEEEGAKLEGGRRVPMSGAGREKGDIKAGFFLIDDKFTDKQSFTITTEMLKKINVQAVGEHRVWQLRISMPGWKLRVLSEEDYLYLQARAANVTNAD